MKSSRIFLFASSVAIAVSSQASSFDRPAKISRRQTGLINDTESNSSLKVDLGYEIYQGISDASSKLNIYNGIRFAAPPTGSNRFQAPQSPTTNRSHVIQATHFGPQCLQDDSTSTIPSIPGSADGAVPTSEDCLFLNVFAPQNAENLPVLVWIHGGGYAAGNGRQSLASLMNANNNSFIGVSIQYRLGALGFLSSDEVAQKGSLNVGLRDQMFALEWVQKHIYLFGGNSSAVTIAGESAGAGSVMLQAMAFSGQNGNRLFNNIIAASPYLPAQHPYNGQAPTQNYFALAVAAGCFQGQAASPPINSTSVFDCLVSKDTATIQNATNAVTAKSLHGTFVYVPVTDGSLIQDIPSQQFLRGNLNGIRLLSGHNANEGAAFVPPNIHTENDVKDWLHSLFPNLSSRQLSSILYQYPVTPNATKIPTVSTNPPGIIARTQRQRADIISGEVTIVCPAYWLAEGFSGEGKTSYMYQYSVLPSFHFLDTLAYFGQSKFPIHGKGFIEYFQKIWGNFVVHGDPSVANNGNLTKAVSDWPIYEVENPMLMNLNQTGGLLINGSVIHAAVEMFGLSDGDIEFYVDPGLEPAFSLVDAYTADSGRGKRCDFWKSIGAIIPE